MQQNNKHFIDNAKVDLKNAVYLEHTQILCHDEAWAYIILELFSNFSNSKS